MPREPFLRTLLQLTEKGYQRNSAGMELSVIFKVPLARVSCRMRDIMKIGAGEAE